VAAPSFFENAAVLTAASQQHGISPSKLQIPANHMPEKPTEYTTPVLPQKAQPDRYDADKAAPVIQGPMSLLPTRYSSKVFHDFLESRPSNMEITKRIPTPTAP